MHWKDYIPALDGRSYGAIRLPISHVEQPYDQVLDQAYTETLAHLDRHYAGAVKCYQLDELLTAWIDPTVLRAELLNVCKLYIVLDHFYARLPVINSTRNRGRSLEWPEYLRHRMYDSGGHYAAARLKLIAIFGLMPESWVGEEELKRAIYGEIGDAGAVERPTVKFDMKIARSGRTWMRDSVLYCLKQLKFHLDQHRPRIMTYVKETKDYRYITRSVIAYQYQVHKGDMTQIYAHHPGARRTVTISAHVEGSRCYADGERIAGFYLENYQPETVPVRGWVRGLRALFLTQAFWYLRRVFSRCIGWLRKQWIKVTSRPV